MSSPQVDWFSQNAPDPIQAAMGRKPVPHTDDWFAANHPAAGPNDPNGNYDFGEFGKVKGARMNGHVATRAEAFHSMSAINGLAQSMASSVQQHQQAFEDLRKSFTTDQMTKDLLGDLATMAVAGGASKLAGLGRWTALGSTAEKAAISEAAKPASGGDWFADHAPGIGPGTAHVTDPGFEGRKFGIHADYLNQLDQHEISGRDVVDFNGFLDAAKSGLFEKGLKSMGDTTTTASDVLYQSLGAKTPAVTDLLYKYDTDPEFRRLADASRHYVHNNTAMIEASRRALGMEPQMGNAWVHDAQDDRYMFDSGTTMLNGKKFDPTGGTSKGNTWVHWEDARKLAEDLHTGIREAPLTNRTLYRGVSTEEGNQFMAPTNEAEAAHKAFYGLKAGDKLDLPLSSFTKSEPKANEFTSSGDKPVILVLEGPSQHVNMQPFSTFEHEQEFATQGGFQINRIVDKPAPSEFLEKNPQRANIIPRYIYVKQLNTF